MATATQEIYHNGKIAVKMCEHLGWMIATRDGWWPVDQLDVDTLVFLRRFRKDVRFPFEFHRYVYRILHDDPARRRKQYPHTPVLDGARIDRE